MEIKKKEILLFKIKDGHNWADISIDYEGSKGRINIASDYISGNYYWGSAGNCFLTFLTTLNMEYVADKLNYDREVDVIASVKHIERYAMEQDVSSEEYNEELEILKTCSPNDFLECVLHSKTIMSLHVEGYPDIEYKVAHLFQRFWKEMWIPFCDHLKEHEIITTNLVSQG